MKIVVCIKQVPNTTQVKIDPETKRIVREGVESIVNPYDAYALEEAVRLKERFGGETIVLSMGPKQAETALREALSMGVDKAILLSDRTFAGSDTLATSYTLAAAVKKIGQVDIIICGREALDGSTGQVGPEMAENLGIPYITYTSKIVDIRDGWLNCERMMEDHYETLKAPLPVLLTVIKEINVPRIPSLKGMLKSKSAAITIWTGNDLGGDINRLGEKGSPTKVMDVWTHQVQRTGEILSGTPTEAVEQLYQKIKKLNIL